MSSVQRSPQRDMDSDSNSHNLGQASEVPHLVPGTESETIMEDINSNYFDEHWTGLKFSSSFWTLSPGPKDINYSDTPLKNHLLSRQCFATFGMLLHFVLFWFFRRLRDQRPHTQASSGRFNCINIVLKYNPNSIVSILYSYITLKTKPHTWK